MPSPCNYGPRYADEQRNSLLTALGAISQAGHCCPQVEFEKPEMNVEHLLKYGNLLVDEQENVRRVQLADSYLKGAELAGSGNGAPKQSLLG